jgi:hypothetical protein
VNQALQARFFHTQYLCGIESIQMTLEKTMEYILPDGIMNVECPRASLIHRFENGSMVILTGHLWVQFVMTLDGTWKIGHLDFNFSQGHQEYINRSSISLQGKKKQQLPESLVNQWGIPPRVFYLLEIADIAVARMSEIIFHSLVSGSTPRESLQAIALDKQQRSIGNDMMQQLNSPIVKTQQQQQRPPQTLQQQAALRLQLNNNANNFQFPPQGPQTPMAAYPQQQPSYPIQQQQQQQAFIPSSPVSRKFSLTKGK